jgi:hypothetical protein
VKSLIKMGLKYTMKEIKIDDERNVGRGGIEPPTLGFSVLRSTD